MKLKEVLPAKTIPTIILLLFVAIPFGIGTVVAELNCRWANCFMCWVIFILSLSALCQIIGPMITATMDETKYTLAQTLATGYSRAIYIAILVTVIVAKLPQML